jgi:hypothetical protein
VEVSCGGDKGSFFPLLTLLRLIFVELMGWEGRDVGCRRGEGRGWGFVRMKNNVENPLSFPHSPVLPPPPPYVPISHLSPPINPPSQSATSNP